jgi:hypothetical protein
MLTPGSTRTTLRLSGPATKGREQFMEYRGLSRVNQQLVQGISEGVGAHRLGSSRDTAPQDSLRESRRTGSGISKHAVVGETILL